MKKPIISLLTVLLVSGCAQTSSSMTTVNSTIFTAPQKCEIESVVSAFDQLVPGSEYVSTDWQPAEGTDLFDIYKANGIACSYGIQSAEIGGTIMWAKISQQMWDTKKKVWLSNGQIEIDIPQINESSATSLKPGATGADQRPTWATNLYIHGVWIQVGASFISSPEEALPIIKSAIAALEETTTKG